MASFYPIDAFMGYDMLQQEYWIEYHFLKKKKIRQFSLVSGTFSCVLHTLIAN